MKIAIPRHLSLAQFRLELIGLIDELERLGITSVACPEIELLALAGEREISLAKKSLHNERFGERAYLLPASKRIGLGVAADERNSVLGPALTAYAGSDTFEFLPALSDAEAKVRYVALGNRWGMGADDIHHLSRQRFRIDGLGMMFAEASDGYSASHAERLSLLERIADAGRLLMGSDEIVGGWLHGPYPMAVGGRDTPWSILVLHPWRRILLMALALELHVALRRDLGDTEPSLVGPGYGRIVVEREYLEGPRIPVEEAHQYIETPREPPEAILTSKHQLSREVEALALAEDERTSVYGADRDRPRGRRL